MPVLQVIHCSSCIYTLQVGCQLLQKIMASYVTKMTVTFYGFRYQLQILAVSLFFKQSVTYLQSAVATTARQT